MMCVSYLGFAALLFASGIQSVDCAPKFIKTPSVNGKVYVDEGANSIVLSWDYNSDGETVNWVDLMYGDEILIARKTVNKELEISPTSGFSGRITFSGNATFKLWNIVQSDGRKFECKVYFKSVVSPWIKSRVELVVVGKPNITLKTKEPAILTEGDTKTLLCVVSDYPKPLITWYKGNTTVQKDPDNSNYTITSANKNHTGTYRCEAVVTAPGLRTYKTSYTVGVIVRFKPQHKRDSLISNQTVVEGSDVEFYCRTEAFPAATTFRWFKDGSRISNSNDYAIEEINNEESRLTVRQANKSSASRYSCDGKNGVAIGREKSAFLIVNYAPRRVILTPDPAVMRLNQTIILTCQADGFPTPSFSWKFNGNVLNGVVQNTLALTNAEVKDAGNYTCVATNDFGGEESTSVVYFEYRPTSTLFTTGTPDNTVVQGATVTLTCSAKGYPAPTYTIKRGNTTVGSVQGKFIIPAVHISEENQNYSCEPRNKAGTGLTKQLRITVEVPPTFSSQLPTMKTTKNENETVSYSCAVEAKPAATIQWILNGQNLTYTAPYNISSSVEPTLNSKLLKTLAYLTVKRVTWRQHGNFSCLAFNDAGKKSQTAELDVRYRPVFQFPDDHPKNLTLAEGATATFLCKTIDNPATQSHKWQFNGVDIPGESCSGCLKTTYTKAVVAQADAGWYSCTGTNILGEGPPAKARLIVRPFTVPTDRGTVEATRNADDTTVILVTWTVTDPAVATLSLEMQEGGEGQWKPVKGASGLSRSTAEFKVTDLKVDKSYRFRMDMRRPGQQNPVFVLSEAVPSVSSDRGVVKATRMSNDATVILVKWTVTDPAVIVLSLEIQEGGEGQWEPVQGIGGLNTSTTEFKVTDLKTDKRYRFRMDMTIPGKQNHVYVYGNIVSPSAKHLKQTDVHNAGLSIGAVSGIVIAIIVIIILACLAVYVVWNKTQGHFKVRRYGEHDNKQDSTQYAAVPSNVRPQARKPPRVTYV